MKLIAIFPDTHGFRTHTDTLQMAVHRKGHASKCNVMDSNNTDTTQTRTKLHTTQPEKDNVWHTGQPMFSQVHRVQSVQLTKNVDWKN